MASYLEIACLGDSIANGFFDKTAKGWIARTIEKLNEQKPYGFYLNNYARSGDRSCDAFHKLCHSVVSMRPDVLLIAVGINDIQRWDNAQSPLGLSMAVSEEYWGGIINVAKKNVPRIFVFGLIPCNEDAMPEKGVNDRPLWVRNEDIKTYNRFLANLCEKENLEFCNFYDNFEKTGGNALLYDGSHPNEHGHEWMASHAFEFLKGKI